MLGLVAGLLRGHRTQLLTFALLSALAVTAAVAIPIYLAAGLHNTLRTEVASAALIERSVRFNSSLAPDPVQLAGELRKAEALLPATTFERLTSLTVSGARVGREGVQPLSLTFVDGACAQLSVSGRCATGVGEVSLTAATAQQLGVRVGDRLNYQAGSVEPVVLTVVGVHRPVDPTATFWSGRTDVAVDADRSGPGLVGLETLTSTRPVAVGVSHEFVLRADIPADPAALRTVLAGLTPALVANRDQVTALPQLIDRLERNDRAASRGGFLVGGQLALITGFVVLLTASYAAAERRDESAMAALRGAPMTTRLLVALAPSLLTLLVVTPAGLAAGYGLGALAVRWSYGAAPDSGLGWSGLAAALIGVGLTVLAAVVHRPVGSLLEGLRRTPPRFRVRSIDVVTLVAVALAVAASYETRSLGPTDAAGLALLGPALLALAGGLLAARLVPPIAAAYARQTLRGGRLAPGLAAMQLARRPGTHRVLAVLIVSVALVVQAVAAAEYAGRAAEDRARWELGADRVLSVRASGPEALRQAVHDADPEGRWAMAAIRSYASSAPIVAVEADRLAAVLTRPRGLDRAAVAGLSAALRTPSNPPVIVDGRELVLDLTVAEVSALSALTIHLVTARGEAVLAQFALAERVGRARYRAAVPRCAEAGGCRIAWLGFAASPDRLRLHALAQTDPDRELLTAADLAAPGRWRPGFNTAPEQVTFLQEGDYLTASYQPADPRSAVNEVRLRLADAPVPLPVVAAGPAELLNTDVVRDLPGLDLDRRPVEVVSTSAILPGVGTSGYYVDYEYATRVLEGPASGVGTEVWLAAGTPQSVVDRLTSAGVRVLGSTDVSQRRTHLREQGPGLVVRLYLVAALIALLLGMIALAVVAAVDRAGRQADLTALRRQGLPMAVVRGAGRRDQVALVLAGVVIGAAVGWLSWSLNQVLLPVFTDDWPVTVAPRWLPSALAVLVVAVVLLGTVTVAARRLTHRDESP